MKLKNVFILIVIVFCMVFTMTACQKLTTINVEVKEVPYFISSSGQFRLYDYETVKNLKSGNKISNAFIIGEHFAIDINNEGDLDTLKTVYLYGLPNLSDYSKGYQSYEFILNATVERIEKQYSPQGYYIILLYLTDVEVRPIESYFYFQSTLNNQFLYIK